MNSCYEFTQAGMIMKSDMLHAMTYEFKYELMYMKNIVKSYLKSWVPRLQMSLHLLR